MPYVRVLIAVVYWHSPCNSELVYSLVTDAPGVLRRQEESKILPLFVVTTRMTLLRAKVIITRMAI